MSHENDVRDHALSRLYREGAWPEPGRQIDQAILAASRRASRERHPLIWRWAPPFAVAATVVLTSAVALKAYREKPEIVAPVTLEEAPAVRAKQAAPERKTEAKPAPAQPSVTTPQGFSSSMDMLEAERLERAKRDLGLKDLPPPGTPVQAAKPVPSAAYSSTGYLAVLGRETFKGRANSEPSDPSALETTRNHLSTAERLVAKGSTRKKEPCFFSGIDRRDNT